jgi:hypothetical protein
MDAEREKQGMSGTLKWLLIAGGAVVVGAALVWGGIGIGRTLAYRQIGPAGYGAGMGWGMTGAGPVPGADAEFPCASAAPGLRCGYGGGPGMMGGRGMMGRGYGYGPGMMGRGYGPGMMDGYGPDMMDGYGPGMMDGYGWDDDRSGVEPLSIEQAQDAVEDYLAELGDDDLALEEVMIFDNQAYAEVVEGSTGIGAMELLVDPVTLAVYPEHGPNMMWNLKYSPMASGAGGYGMMGGRIAPSEDVSAEMPVSADEAVEAAQRYLDGALPGAEADEHAEPFYGYYTLHVTRDGEVIGMLSVNGYSGQVFPHTWHGDFIEMSGE